MKNIIYCHSCKSTIKKVLFNIKLKDGYNIWKCKCDEYPEVIGILYLKKDTIQKDAVYLIKNTQYTKALFKLVDVHPILSYCLKVLFLTDLYKIIGFNNTIKTMMLFGYSKKWAKYLLVRKKDLSFNLSILVTRFIAKNDLVLDFGTGIGQLLPFVSNRNRGANTYAVDNSMLSLLIARYFYCPRKTLLMCLNAESGLPFKTKSLTRIIACDSIDDILNKKYFFSEVGRVTTSNASIYLIHIINAAKTVYGSVHAIKANTLNSMLVKLGFSKINIFRNHELWEFEKNNLGVNLKKVFKTKNLNDKEAYSVLAAKKTFPKI